MIVLLTAGCARTTADWAMLSSNAKRDVLNSIADGCKLNRTAFELRAGDELNFRPDANARYESVDCALGRLKNVIGLSKIGFVGNEAYTNEAQ